MDMVQTEKLVFEYEKRDEEGNVIGVSRAVDEVDIDVQEGQFIAILGHNGSGKSTLLRGLLGLLPPLAGSIQRAAELDGTIVYELLCRISPRVPRIYRTGGAALP